MRLKFLHNISFVLLLNLTVKPFWIFAIDRQVQNLAGPATYGSYYTLLNFSILLSALLDAGISNYNARKVAMQHENGLREQPQLLGLKTTLFIGYLMLSMGAGWLLGYSTAALSWLLLICFNQGLNSLNLYLRSNLAGLHLFKLEGAMGVLDKLLMSLGALPLVLGQAYGSGNLITDFILVQTAAYLLTALGLFALMHQRSRLQWQWSAPQQKRILRQTLPFATLGILMGLYTKIDAVMLEFLLPDGAYAAGIYAAGYRLLDAMSMVPILMSGVLLPQFSRLLAEGPLPTAFVRTAALLLGGTAYVAALLLSWHSDFVMQLLYHHHEANQTRVFELLVLSFIPLSLNYVFGTLLTAAGQLKKMNAFALAGLLLNLLLNAWLIPQQGAVGAALATLFTQTGICLLQFGASYRHQQWRTSRLFLARIALFVVLALAAKSLLPAQPQLGSLLLGSATGLLLLLLFFGQPIYLRLKAQFNSRF